MAPAIQPVTARKNPGNVAKSPYKGPSGNAAVSSMQTSATSSVPISSDDDGTSQLLRWGGLTLGVGVVFALLTRTILGGIGPQGPHTSLGWMALIVTMMCLPFGSLLFLLGALKWLRNRRAQG